MQALDFSKIVLTKDEQRLFQKFKSGNPIELNRDFAYPLLICDLIRQNVVGIDNLGNPITDSRYIISDIGRKYVEFLRIQCLNKVSSEARGWITTAIAVAAFVLSVISLISQSRK